MSTKSRRPGAVVVTPPPMEKQRKRYSAAEKQTLLENFDLEVADKTRAFRASLAATLASFVMRQETEILKIPRDLRSLKIGELEPKYGGSWSGTLQKIARDKIEEREKEEEQARAKKEQEAVKGKRKRATGNTSDSSPARTNKNARRDVPGSSSKRAPTRKTTAKISRSKPTSASSGPSALPQDHVFNPALPPTPSFARAARHNESFFSANGSPIAVAGVSSEDEAETDRRNSDADSDDSDELPDPDAYEAKLQARAAAAGGSPKSRPSAKSQPSNPSRKPKRAPSLIFRKPLAPGLTPTPPLRENDTGAEEVVLSSIDLGDGRAVSFNPYQLSPGRIRDEMDQAGIGKAEQEVFIEKIRNETIRMLSEKMDRWNMF